MVYDRSHGQDLADRDSGVSDDDLRNITGINPEQEGAMDREATNGAAADILGRERAAAAGKSPNSTKPSPTSLSQGGTGSEGRGSDQSTDQSGPNGARQALKDKEGEGLYKPSSDDGGGLKSQFRQAKRLRRRLAVAGMLSGLIGGGGGFATFGIISGPLQFLQLGELLHGFHLQEKEDQGNSRVTKQVRNLRYLVKGKYERTRLGTVGNYFADAIQNKMRERGFDVKFENGKYKYIINPDKLSPTDYPDLENRDPATVQKYFSDKFGVQVGGDLSIDAPKGYFSQRSLFKQVLKTTGLKWTSPLSMRTTGRRMAFGFHWMNVLSGRTLDEKYRAWLKDQYEKIKNGTKPPEIGATDGKDKQGNPDGNTSDSFNELADEGKETATKIGAGDTAAKGQLIKDLGGKLGAGIGGLLAIACIIDAIGRQVDLLNYINVVLPAAKMGMQAVSKSGQIQDDKDVDETQLGFDASLLNDPDPKVGNWFSARSIQAESGRAMSGPDAIPDLKINKENFAKEFAANVHIDDVCHFLEETVAGTVITIALSLFNPVESGVQYAIFSVIGPPLIDWLANMLAADSVDTLAKGATRGNIMNYGVRWAGNDLAVSRGGVPLTSADEAAIAANTRQEQQEDFDSHNLAYRLFNTEDPKSFIAQVINNQSSDPGQNVSHAAMGLLNMGNSFGSMIGSLVSDSVGAAPLRPYDYGFPDFGFTPDEMNADAFDNPFENANKVADILDANTASTAPDSTDNYIYRAQQCFGITISKDTVTLPGETQPVQQYSIKAPVVQDKPLQIDQNISDNHCADGSNYGHQNAAAAGVTDWTRVRMYIFDSQMMNGTGCLEGQDKDPVSKQACIDIGLDPGAGGGAGGGYSGQAIPTGDLPGYKEIFADDFNVPAALGSWGSDCDSGRTAYTGTGPVGTTIWHSYPTCFKDTYQKRPYRADQVLDVGNGNLRFHLHQVDGQPAGANPSPVLPASGAGMGAAGQTEYQTYGRYIARFKVEPHSGDMHEYYLAWLLWPPNDGDYQSAESDYPEGSLGDPKLEGFHHSSGGQEGISIPGYGNHDWTQWHNYIQEWEPGVRRYYVDNSQPFVTSNPVWSGPERWQLQTETNGDGNSDGYLYVDWVVVYCSTNAGCKLGG